MNEDKIITILREIHREPKHRLEGSDVPRNTRLAQKITTEWQKEVCNGLIKKEVKTKNSNVKIDIVDFNFLTAYELKVSGKNPQHEFFKDIFKVILFNECPNEYANKKIRKLKFISEKKGIEKLDKLIKNTKLFEIVKKKHKIDIELISI